MKYIAPFLLLLAVVAALAGAVAIPAYEQCTASGKSGLHCFTFLKYYIMLRVWG